MRLPTSDEVRLDIRHAQAHLWTGAEAIMRRRGASHFFVGWGCLGFPIMVAFWMAKVGWWGLKAMTALTWTFYKALYVLCLLLVLVAIVGREKWEARGVGGGGVT